MRYQRISVTPYHNKNLCSILNKHLNAFHAKTINKISEKAICVYNPLKMLFLLFFLPLLLFFYDKTTSMFTNTKAKINTKQRQKHLELDITHVRHNVDK